LFFVQPCFCCLPNIYILIFSLREYLTSGCVQSCRETEGGQWQRIEEMALANPRQWFEDTLKALYEKEGVALVQGSGVYGLDEAESTSDDPKFTAARKEISARLPSHFKKYKR
jgi:hypothetical protein